MEWIKCSDRMPQEGESVIMTDGVKIFIAQYFSGTKSISPGIYVDDNIAKYWTNLPPLPKPPK